MHFITFRWKRDGGDWRIGHGLDRYSRHTVTGRTDQPSPLPPKESAHHAEAGKRITVLGQECSTTCILLADDRGAVVSQKSAEDEGDPTMPDRPGEPPLSVMGVTA
jgi:hypothetical protein